MNKAVDSPVDKKLNKACKKNITIIILTLIIVGSSFFTANLYLKNLELEEDVSGLQTINSNLEFSISEIKEENLKITREKKDLYETIGDLTSDNNKLIETVKKVSNLGKDLPSRHGITPDVKFTTVSRSEDRRLQQQIFERISKGSYQFKSEKVVLNVNDRTNWKSLGEWKVSAYTATVGETDSNPSNTASGTLVTPAFTVAVDNKYWKFGTIFYFQGLGFGIAADTGGYVKGRNRADFLVASKSVAYQIDGNYNVFLVYLPK